jgi:hypothetical protein
MSDVNPDRSMSLKSYESLTDENTVGILHEWERGPNTVEFTNVRHAISTRLDDGIGDDDSRLFIGSDSGELEVSYGPLFDVPIVTNLRKWEASLALRTLREEVGYEDVDLLFDDAGPIVFRSGGMRTVATPANFPWQHGSQPQRPRSPCGPSLRGESE